MAGLFEFVLFGDEALKLRPVPGHLKTRYLMLFRDRNAILDQYLRREHVQLGLDNAELEELLRRAPEDK